MHRIGLPRRVALLITAGLVITACSTGAGASGPAATDRPSTSPAATTAAPSGGVLPAELAAAITADAATVLGVDPAAVQIVSAEATTWNDGALGCPKLGVMYVQIVTDGYRVIVGSGDQQLDYRTGRDGGFKICEGFKPGGAQP